MNRDRIYFVFLLLIFPGLSACASVQTSPELTPVTVQLRWTHQSQFAGFYAAAQNGDYAAEGFSVKFLEGGPEVDIHTSVEQGQAQFGVAGADTLILKRAEGMPFKALAIIYRRNPLVFISLAESEIIHPQDFVGKTILVASFNQPVLHAMTSHVEVTPDQYTEICCDFEGFLAGKSQVAHAYLTNEVITVPRQGYDLNIISPDDYGVHFYADALYTVDQFIAENPDLVRRFLRATLEGWRYAIENPHTIGSLVQKYNPEADPNLEVAKMTASIPLVNTGEDFIGWMEPQVWTAMDATLREQGVLNSPLEVEQVYTLQFIEEIYR